MRLLSCRIQNFKLLENVAFDFSTDTARPLTVIRAENGSGKTSVLYALLWAFYGMPGLPAKARDLRLTSAAIPAGRPVSVSVMVEFDHLDDVGETTRYRLIRSVTETPAEGDKVSRQGERPRLFRLTAAGEEPVANEEAVIARMVPPRLRDVFFTNGDDVQRFISGESTQQRQSLVHQTIKALLGHDSLRTGVDDINAVYTKLRSEVAKQGGSDTAKIEADLKATDEEVQAVELSIAAQSDLLTNMAEKKEKWDKELNSLRGIGDLEALNLQIKKAQKDQDTQEQARSRALNRMRLLLKDETLSWRLLGPRLDKGFKVLSELADRRVIPGTSIEVLNDRLELEQCICDEPLSPGTSHRAAVEKLRDQQASIDATKKRLTALFHQARQSHDLQAARANDGSDFDTQRTALLDEFTEIRDALKEAGTSLTNLQERRALIDEERVQDLTSKLRTLEAKQATANTTMGALRAQLAQALERRELQAASLAQAEKAVKINDDLATRREVAKDLHDLVKNTLAVLEGDYVERVSGRMNELFLEIVGSDPDSEAGVFTSVTIDHDYNIVIHTQGGRRLDADFELNGASQRALTLSFIWALMEISGTTAPRIIDTPLGMVAGGVKKRMVDIITRPSNATGVDFQVILLLTRSEIRDVETLLDERAGSITTLSCSKDFPEDLRFNWQVDHPLSRVCACTHRQSCRVCARQYDEQHGIDFRDLEATA